MENTVTGRTVRWELGDNHGSFPNQAVEVDHVEADGTAYGTWRGRLVGAFSVRTQTWHVLNVDRDQALEALRQ